jgi:hypothetical protein
MNPNYVLYASMSVQQQGYRFFGDKKGIKFYFGLGYFYKIRRTKQKRAKK